MHSTVNGIGTSYWGKKNFVSIQSQCEHCGNPSTLRSYDTRHCFVVLFIPLIPLGKKRIIDYCDRCTRHIAMPLEQWQQEKDNAIQVAATAYSSDQGNRDKAMELVGVALGWRDFDAFHMIAGGMSDRFRNDAEVQMALADAYQVMGRTQDEEACVRRAVAADASYSNHLAVLLIQTNRSLDALPMLDKVFREPSPDNLRLAMFLVKGLQAQGEHKRCLTLLARIAEAYPDVVETKDYIKLRKTSMKHQNSNKKIAPKKIMLNTNDAKTPRRWNAWFLVIAAAALAYLGGSFWAGQREKVVLVNGWTQEQVFQLNGDTFRLNPLSHSEFTIDEGEIHIMTRDGLGNSKEHSLTIKTPFFTRLFQTKHWVINPDQTALFLKEHVVYSVNPDDGQNDFELIWGDLLMDFSNIDYFMRTPPESLRLESTQSKAVKSHISMVVTNLYQRLNLFMATGQEARLTDYLKAQVMGNPMDDQLITIIAQMLPFEESRDFLKTGLAQRPLLTDWHRIYQSILQYNGQNPIQEYEDLLKERPEDANAQYLLSRITEDSRRKAQLLSAAIAADPPSPYAHLSLGFDAMASGQFEQAWEHAQYAHSKLPRHDAIASFWRNTAWANGRHNELEKHLRSAMYHDPDNGDLVADFIRLCITVKKPVGSIAVDFLARQLDEWGADLADHWRSYFNCIRAYCINDLEELGRLAADFDIMAFELALIQSKGVLPMVDESSDALSCLALAAAAHKVGSDALSEKAISMAKNQLFSGNADHRALQECLGDGYSLDKALALALETNIKAMALTLLGLQHPEHQKTLFDEARKLNFKQEFPYLTIKHITGP